MSSQAGMKKLDCCVQGQGHSEGSKCLWIFCPVSLWFMSRVTKRVSGEKIVLLCSSQVTAKVQNVNEFLPRWYFLNCWTFCYQTWLMWWGIIMGRSVMWKDWFTIFKVKVTVSTHTIKFDCFYHINLIADPFATKFNGMVHHKLERSAWCKDWMAVAKVSHAEGSKLLC